MAASKVRILRLFKDLMREGQKFDGYNFRNYAARRTRDAFKENKQLSDQSVIEKEIKFGQQQLDLIKRQVPDFCCLFTYSLHWWVGPVEIIKCSASDNFLKHAIYFGCNIL
ncbi:Hypothetical predicted protein [Cloeon dipterum]|uniref:Complex 1 LYR protein domain-containing protein n=1 Tax=Cloeon dipterum TaxID=197152 RepID=A0A8S1C1U6_9INSE|nr:Hypothetical predicted protein [Cloeon dipterum]